MENTMALDRFSIDILLGNIIFQKNVKPAWMAQIKNPS